MIEGERIPLHMIYYQVSLCLIIYIFIRNEEGLSDTIDLLPRDTAVRVLRFRELVRAGKKERSARSF